MNMLDREQHSVCKVEGHHSRDDFDNSPNMLCSVQSSCEVVPVLHSSLYQKARRVLKSRERLKLTVRLLVNEESSK